jgi:hypothetical protein
MFLRSRKPDRAEGDKNERQNRGTADGLASPEGPPPRWHVMTGHGSPALVTLACVQWTWPGRAELMRGHTLKVGEQQLGYAAAVKPAAAVPAIAVTLDSAFKAIPRAAP